MPRAASPGRGFRAHLQGGQGKSAALPLPSPGAVAAFRGAVEGDGAVAKPRRDARNGAEDRLREGLESFSVPPQVLLPPGAIAPSPSPAAARAAQHVETAALIERFVTSMRVGRVGTEHAVHMRLKVGHSDGVDVRLESAADGVCAVLRGGASDRQAVEKLAANLEGAFAARGIKLQEVRIEAM